MRSVLADMQERSDNWMNCQIDAFEDVKAARMRRDVAKANNRASKSELKAAKLVYREVQMPVHATDEQRELKRLKALLALRNAELKAFRSEAKASRAVADLNLARQRQERVAQGEGYELSA